MKLTSASIEADEKLAAICEAFAAGQQPTPKDWLELAKRLRQRASAEQRWLDYEMGK